MLLSHTHVSCHLVQSHLHTDKFPPATESCTAHTSCSQRSQTGQMYMSALLKQQNNQVTHSMAAEQSKAKGKGASFHF